MITIVVAIRLCAKFLSHSTVHIYCDNAAVVQVQCKKLLFYGDLILSAFLLHIPYFLPHLSAINVSNSDALIQLFYKNMSSTQPNHFVWTLNSFITDI